MSRASRLELLRELKDHLSQIERPRPSAGAIISTGVAALDGLLPRKGLEWGTLSEWLSAGESGAMALTLAVAARVLQENDVLAVIDGPGEFYPPAAAGLGIPLERLVLVRPRHERDALWAWEQALRSGAVAIVLGWLDALNDRAFRKLQLAAETGGSLAFLLRPARPRDEPSWAEARFLVASIPNRVVNLPMSRISGGEGWGEGGQHPTHVSDSCLKKRPSSCKGITSPLTLTSSPEAGGEGTDETASPMKIRTRSASKEDARPLLLAPRARYLRVELLYARNGVSGGVIELEMSDETDEAGLVSMVSRLADPAAAPRPTRA